MDEQKFTERAPTTIILVSASSVRDTKFQEGQVAGAIEAALKCYSLSASWKDLHRSCTRLYLEILIFIPFQDQGIPPNMMWRRWPFIGCVRVDKRYSTGNHSWNSHKSQNNA